MSSKKNNLKFAIVGATGMVGTAFLNLLQERDYHPIEIRLFASDASARPGLGNDFLANPTGWFISGRASAEVDDRSSHFGGVCHGSRVV